MERLRAAPRFKLLRPLMSLMGFWLQRSVSRCRAKLVRKLSLSAYKRPQTTIKRRRKRCWRTCLRMQQWFKSLLVLERTHLAAMMLKRISELKATCFTCRTRLKIIQWTWQRETRLWRLLSSRVSSVIISSNSLLIQGHSLMSLILSPRPKKRQAPIASLIPPSCSNTQRKNSRLRATVLLLVIAAWLRRLCTLIFGPSSHQFLNEASSSRNLHRALDRLTTWVAAITGRKVIALACVTRPSWDQKCSNTIWASSKSTCVTLPKNWQMYLKTPTPLTSAPSHCLSLRPVWACPCCN